MSKFGIKTRVLSKDGQVLFTGKQVWYFDPYDNFRLKNGFVTDVYVYGPEIKTGLGNLLYNCLAVWVNEGSAVIDGPPVEIYRNKVKGANSNSSRIVKEECVEA